MMGFSRNIEALRATCCPLPDHRATTPGGRIRIPSKRVGSGKCAKYKTSEEVQRKKTRCVTSNKRRLHKNSRSRCVDAFTCRLMKLEVVSEDVLPSERLKRLLRLGNFLGSCGHREDTRLNCPRWFSCSFPGLCQHSPPQTNVAACAPPGPPDELGYKCTSASGAPPYGACQMIKHSLRCDSP